MKMFTLTAIAASLITLLLGCQKPITTQQQATDLALNVISGSLVAPTTARFSSHVFYRDLGDNSFLVLGKVDAQNAYGAMIREDWAVVITNTGVAGLDWIVMNVGDSYQENPKYDSTRQMRLRVYGIYRCPQAQIMHDMEWDVQSDGTTYARYLAPDGSVMATNSFTRWRVTDDGRLQMGAFSWKIEGDALIDGDGNRWLRIP